MNSGIEKRRGLEIGRLRHREVWRERRKQEEERRGMILIQMKDLALLGQLIELRKDYNENLYERENY